MSTGYRVGKAEKPEGPDKVREIFSIAHYHGPLGTYALGSSEKCIVCVKTEEQAGKYFTRWQSEGIELREKGEDILDRLQAQLDAYFAGKLRHFTLPLDLRGTPFQRLVWDYLLGIPWGETRSYGQVAGMIGKGGARAVGRAVGTNPVSIIVPCHRVIGSDGSLTGYGGGLERKAALLELENVHRR